MAGTVKVVLVGYASRTFGERSYTFSATPGMKLRDLLVQLSQVAKPDFKEAVYDPVTDRANEYLTIFVNTREARSLNGLDTTLKEGDVVTFMPPMAGGSVSVC